MMKIGLGSPVCSVRCRISLEHLVGDPLGDPVPDVDDLVVPLAGGDDAGGALLLDLLDLVERLVDQLFLRGSGTTMSLGADRDPGVGRPGEAEVLEGVEQPHRDLVAVAQVGEGDQALQPALLELAVDERQLGRQRRVEDHPPDRGLEVEVLDPLRLGVQDVLLVRLDGHVEEVAGVDHLDRLQRVDAAGWRGPGSTSSIEAKTLRRSPSERLLGGQVVDAQHHVLRRHGERLAGRRRQDVARRQHEDARLELRHRRQRHVDRHLVAVEVGVVGGADERVDADRLALDEHRLERLDAEAVQRRRAVEQDRVLVDHRLERVPHLGGALLDELARHLDRRDQALLLELVVDERLEELERHLLGEPALVELQLGTDHDDGAAGVVDALAEEVLAEAPLLALEGVGERLQRTAVGALDDAAAAAVVEQGVDRLLEHALLVADDHLRAPAARAASSGGCCG